MSAQLTLTEANVCEYLRGVGVLTQSEEGRVEPAGEGNINWVRRVRAGRRSIVVKQARPALERFPEYRVSTERIVFEARYYELAAAFDREGLCPRVEHFDAEQRVLILEDLGDAERFDAALARGADVSEGAASLGAFLGAVHAGTRDPALAEHFQNGEMQRLHGDHIFHLPYRENDFPLPAAQAECARRVRRDATLVEAIDAAHARYLMPEGALVHGDVQPTNILLQGSLPRLVDAEIAHVGDPAFDLGILLAHLWLAAVARGAPATAETAATAVWNAYAESHGPDGLVAFRDAARYAGIEMLRRTLGAARVAAVDDDAVALVVVARGAALVKAPPGDAAQATSSLSESTHSMP